MTGLSLASLQRCFFRMVLGGTLLSGNCLSCQGVGDESDELLER